MAGQTRRTSGPRPSPPRAAQVTPPVVDVPPETPAPVEPEPETAPDVPVEPPPFDPDNPLPGQYVGFLFPHSGYTSAGIGWPDGRTFSVLLDPETDCIVELLG